MDLTRRSFLLGSGAIAAAGAFGLAGCSSGSGSSSSGESSDGSSSGEKIHLVYYNTAGELVDFWEDFFNTYNENNEDNIEVEVVYGTEEDGLQNLMAAGDTPDLFTADITQEMVDDGRIVDIADMDFWDTLYPECKDYSTNVKTGMTVFAPLLMSCVGLFYNKDIFDEVGIEPVNTWDEFVDNLRKIKEAKPDVTPLFIGAGDAWPLGHITEFWVMQQAKEKYGVIEQKQLMVDNDLDSLELNTDPDDQLCMWATRMNQLMEEGLINENVVTDAYDKQNEQFANGEVAMISAGLWTATELTGLTDDTSFISICQYPAIVDGTQASVGDSVDCCIYISAESENVDACKKVIEYLYQPENMEAVSIAKQSPSANPDVETDWGFLKDSVAEVLADDDVAKLTWDVGSWPTGFGNDDAGRILQQQFAGEYDTPEEFAQGWIDAWYNGLN